MSGASAGTRSTVASGRPRTVKLVTQRSTKRLFSYSVIVAATSCAVKSWRCTGRRRWSPVSGQGPQWLGCLVRGVELGVVVFANTSESAGDPGAVVKGSAPMGDRLDRVNRVDCAWFLAKSVQDGGQVGPSRPEPVCVGGARVVYDVGACRHGGVAVSPIVIERECESARVSTRRMRDTRCDTRAVLVCERGRRRHGESVSVYDAVPSPEGGVVARGDRERADGESGGGQAGGTGDGRWLTEGHEGNAGSEGRER